MLWTLQDGRQFPHQFKLPSTRARLNLREVNENLRHVHTHTLERMLPLRVAATITFNHNLFEWTVRPMVLLASSWI